MALAPRLPLAALLLLTGCASATRTTSPPSPPAVDARCAVWARELSFARSVRDHDAAAFADHVLEGAVFVGATTLHGREAVVKGWDDIVRGTAGRFDWHPAEVVVTGDPHVAMSRGPVWIEVAKPGAPVKRLLGAYQSTWVLDGDGVWRVGVDGGQSPHEVSEEEMARSRASVADPCPPDAR
jgi:ketosteroid isomerase-like protein